MRVDVTNTVKCRFCRAPIGQPCRPGRIARLFGRRPGRWFHTERLQDANERWRFLLNHPDHRGTLRPAVIRDRRELELLPTDLWREHRGLGYDREVAG